MSDFVKFSSQLDPAVLETLRRIADESGRTLAAVLNDAATEYIERARVRPAFRKALEAVMEENAELLTRLAK